MTSDDRGVYALTRFLPIQSGRGQEPRRLSIKRSFLLVLIGQSFHAMCQWLVLIALTRFTSTSDVGIFAFGLALASPVFLVLGGRLRAVQASDAAHQYRFSEYVTLRIITSVIAVALSIILISVVPSDKSIELIALITAMKSIESFSDVIWGYWQQQEKMALFSASTMFSGFVYVAFALPVAWLTHDLRSVLIALVASRLVALLVFDIPFLQMDGWQRKNFVQGLRLFANVPIRRVLALAMIAAPLGINSMLGSLNVSIPRFFIDGSLGTHELGTFTALAYPLVASGIIIGSLSQAATPRLARSYLRRDYASFQRDLFGMMMFALFLGLAGIAVAATCGRYILEFMYGEDYARQPDVFTLLAMDAAITFLYVFLGTGLVAARKFLVQLPIHISSTALLVASCFVIVPRFGLKGAATAMILSSAFNLLAYALFVVRALKPDEGS